MKPKFNRSTKNIVILTGAGISAESGIPTFRDLKTGLWENHRVDDVATPEGFAKNPTMVNDFYNQRRAHLHSVQPNVAHAALAKLQRVFTRGEVTLITQNIDDLHERGGFKNPIHMHGELYKVYCTTSRQIFVCRTDIPSACDCCGTNTLRPDIVWFSELPYQMELIERKLIMCDIFISIGTSGNVYPAAGMVNQAKRAGAETLQITLDGGYNNNAFDYTFIGKATEVVPVVIDGILEEHN